MELFHLCAVGCEMNKTGFILALFAAVAALAWLANRSAFFPMQYPAGDWTGQTALGAQDVWLTTSDGLKIHAWWKPLAGAKAVTLFLHGNAGNVTHRAAAMVEIASAGNAVLVPDYRGYGRSGGRPTEQGLYRDADAAYDWLLARGWAAGQIILHGESLGTSVATDLAARRRCAGLILEAPFPSARAVAAHVLPVVGPILVWGFDTRKKIRALRAPLLIIHGASDEIIDFALGQEVFAAAPSPKQFWAVAGAHHNDIAATAGSAYRERLRSFMMNACNAAASSPSP
jgi:hypothetical protein